MPGTMSVSGLISGLSTDEIISKIMEYARRPQTRLQQQKAESQLRLAAWQDINTRVLALKAKSESIADLVDFQAMTATSSNSSIVTATASTSAAPGVYYIRVVSKAQCHQVSSQAGAYTSVNDPVGTGTVRIDLANGTNFSVTLDSSNNTLAGLRDAINKANKGVTATIVNAGTTSAPDYRLLITSSAAGSDNRITLIDTSGLSGGVKPEFDLDNPVQAPAPAVVEIGEGAGKITVTKSTNTITDLIPGVTLNLLNADPSNTVRIEITRNTSQIRQAIEAFVQQYNDLSDAIGDQFEYDTQTGQTLPLFSDFRLQTVHSDIVSAITSQVSGLTSSMKALANLGITQDTTGRLVINSSVLDTALENNMPQVARVFGAGIDSTSSYVSFLASTAETKPSGAVGYEVTITQAARRAQVTAGTAMTGVIREGGESLRINGKLITLDAGMDIDQVIARINSYSSETNVIALKTGAGGTGTGNYLTFRRVQYGSSYDVSVVSNLSCTLEGTTGIGNKTVTSANPEGETGSGQGMVGLDVAGTINGAQATGNGQILSLRSAPDGNGAKGLSLLITASEPLSGVKVVFTKGVGATLRDLLSTLTSTTGAITQAQDSITNEITQLDSEIAQWNVRLNDQEARLYAQFNALESQLAKLRQQSDYLSAQLSAMNKSK
ncbi:MAG: flagellar filament capping protein FliD [Armatimonadetes bacterium]|nr:flagellar filament capping protein FliD [Armatimonadota bacterium]